MHSIIEFNRKIASKEISAEERDAILRCVARIYKYEGKVFTNGERGNFLGLFAHEFRGWVNFLHQKVSNTASLSFREVGEWIRRENGKVRAGEYDKDYCVGLTVWRRQISRHHEVVFDTARRARARLTMS